MSASVPATALQEPSTGSDVGLLRQFARLAGPYWTTERRWQAWSGTLALAALTICQLLLVVRLNLWNADLFDALERKSMERFLQQVAVFGLIVIGMMAVNSAHLWVKRYIQMDWRLWLTGRLLDTWMARGRQYQIGFAPGEHKNPDGRIAEDIRIATENAVDLVHSLFYCGILLISFTGILWSLSGLLQLPIGGYEIAVPGHMVWLALLYAGIGAWLAFAFGRPLVRATDTRQTAEAGFRSGLGHAQTDAETIALSQGEAEERRHLHWLFRPIQAAWADQTLGLLRLVLFSSAHGTLATVFPILVATPRYLAGTITLGGLMQIGQAFQQLTSALSWPIDNFPKIAEWRASAERVIGLHVALSGLDIERDAASRIAIRRTDASRLDVRELCIVDPEGRTVLSGFDASIAPQERVLISGDMEAAQKLFKVLAGVWPWGHGAIDLPKNASMLFLVERPYMPCEPLRRVITWPSENENLPAKSLADTLTRVGAGHLASRLDDVEDWGRTLGPEEQQRLGFARLLLVRPNWVLLDRATSALDAESEQTLMRRLFEGLPAATVLTIGDRPELQQLHDRILILNPSGRRSVMETSTGRSRANQGEIAWRAGRGRRLLEWVRAGFGY